MPRKLVVTSPMTSLGLKKGARLAHSAAGHEVFPQLSLIVGNQWCGAAFPRPRAAIGSDQIAEKRKIVVDRKVSPGLSKVEGKAGWLGLSGKCWVSSATASRF